MFEGRKRIVFVDDGEVDKSGSRAGLRTMWIDHGSGSGGMANGGRTGSWGTRALGGDVEVGTGRAGEYRRRRVSNLKCWLQSLEGEKRGEMCTACELARLVEKRKVQCDRLKESSKRLNALQPFLEYRPRGQSVGTERRREIGIRRVTRGLLMRDTFINFTSIVLF